ncbi:signal peptide protein [Rhodopirellula maiorica SM1]|uniref:Signal peptide protein n=2 Tax=Novipirellula TaxID=2795426 RepID=M5S9L7_9BACT|nr:signal peptide protein [Rhodopirellula maiorica SM1]
MQLRWAVPLLTLLIPPLASAQTFLNVFPKPTAEVARGQRGDTTITSKFTPSESLWDERLDERPVFLAEMVHSQDEDNSFKLRLGQGGQIYSLRGPFGESVPPSWRAAGGKVSPWNDEVWQFVAVCTKYNGIDGRTARGVPSETLERIQQSSYATSFFIHNSGAYIPGNSAVKSLYCPLLASEMDAQNRTIQMLNWGLVPQIKTVHRSPLLYYTQVRDVGDGVIELTWVVHNFSTRDDIVFDHLNAPWGGTRISSLPLRYVSSPEGELLQREGFLSEHGTVDVRDTGGWNISCASDDDDSPSLALVYGRDKHLEAELQRKAAGQPYCQFKHSLYRDWRASEPLYKNVWKDWATRPANSFRNYDVCEIIPKIQIVPGSTIWFRSYLVVGQRSKVIQQATGLVDDVDYGLLTFDPAHSPMTNVENVQVKNAFQVFTQPVRGTMPLMRIRNTKTNQEIITTDPYYFVDKEKLDFTLPTDHPHYNYYRDTTGYSMDKNNSEWLSLVGYAYVDKPTTGNWQKLSTLLDASEFPQPDSHHLDLWVKMSNRKSVGAALPD